jgi:hypothetical protein
MPKPTLAIDFDGVIHCYHLAWGDGGEVTHGPMPGAMRGMWELHLRGYDLVVHTCRTDHDEVRALIERWFAEEYADCGECFPFRVTNVKPPAIAYIDDRGVRFTDWQDLLAMFGKPDIDHVLLPGK